MNHLRLIVFFSGLWLLSGCAWLGSAANNSVEMEGKITAQLVDPQSFPKGGKLLVLAFQAGPNIVADERLDKVALMMIKGLADEIKDKQTQFQIVGAQEAREADYIISGQIIRMVTPPKWRRWMLRPSVNKLSVEGRMTQSASGATIFVFTHSRKITAGRQDYAQLGYEIGKDIGRFLLGTGESSR